MRSSGPEIQQERGDAISLESNSGLRIRSQTADELLIREWRTVRLRSERRIFRGCLLPLGHRVGMEGARSLEIFQTDVNVERLRTAKIFFNLVEKLPGCMSCFPSRLFCVANHSIKIVLRTPLAFGFLAWTPCMDTTNVGSITVGSSLLGRSSAQPERVGVLGKEVD